MTIRFQHLTYQGSDYRVTVGGNGLYLSVDRLVDSSDGGKELEDVFFAQGEDACEFVDYLSEHGAKMLLGYLSNAGIEF